MTKQNLLKSFWEEKRHLFELVGGISAVGAIFLTIPSSEIITANSALEYVKLCWISLIIIGLVVLAIQGVIFSVVFEKEMKKSGLDLDNEFHLLTMFALFFLIYTTCKYAWFQYENQLTYIFSNHLIFVLITPALIRFHNASFKKIMSSELSRSRRIVLESLLSLIISLLFGIMIFIGYKIILNAIIGGVLSISYFLSCNIVVGFKPKKIWLRILKVTMLISLWSLLLFYIFNIVNAQSKFHVWF